MVVINLGQNYENKIKMSTFALLKNLKIRNNEKRVE